MLNFSFCVIFALTNSIAGRYALILVQSQTVNICPMAVGSKKKIKLSKKFTEFSLNLFVVFLVRNYDELILLLDLNFIWWQFIIYSFVLFILHLKFWNAEAIKKLRE